MANWYVRSGAGGTASGANWANAMLTLLAATAACAAGDAIYVSEDHSESNGSTTSLNPASSLSTPTSIYCVNHSGSVPPVSADLRTTAVVATTTTNTLTVGGVNALYYGIIFQCGSGANIANLTVALTSPHQVKLVNCGLTLNNTGSSSKILLAFGGSSKVVCENCTFTFGSTANQVLSGGAAFSEAKILGGSVVVGATVPTNFIGGSAIPNLSFEGVDLSAFGSGKNLVSAIGNRVIFKDCKINASVTVQAAISSLYQETYLFRCDSSGTNYRNEKYTEKGTQTTETGIVRTGGASDGTTAVSAKIVSGTDSKWATIQFEALPIAIWNDVTGSNVTVTVEGLQDPRTSTSLPNNDDIWFDVEYLGSASSPIGTFKKGTKADGLATGSALTASTQAWDSLVTARANSTAYSLGDARKVATNTGRVFICTTAGTSAGSEPGGYATAVDGGAVTDGTATFTAAVRFKQAITLSSPQPAQKGALYVYPKVAKASATFYVDPLIALS